MRDRWQTLSHGGRDRGLDRRTVDAEHRGRMRPRRRVVSSMERDERGRGRDVHGRNVRRRYYGGLGGDDRDRRLFVMMMVRPIAIRKKNGGDHNPNTDECNGGGHQCVTSFFFLLIPEQKHTPSWVF